MRTYGFRSYLAAGLAGVGIFLAVLHTVFALAWVCMVPLFVAVDGAAAVKGATMVKGTTMVNGAAFFATAPYAAARMGFVTGAFLSVCGFYWMIPGAETFTGNSAWYGIAVFVLCMAAFSLYWSMLLFVFAWLRRRLTALSVALLAGSLWVCAEAGLQWLAKGMPWFLFHTGNALAGNLYAIQPVCWTGIHGATFAVVAVNYAIARCILRRNWRGLIWPVGAILVYLGVGWSLLQTVAAPGAGSFSLALLSEQIPPSVQWDSASGNRLVARLLDLDREASSRKPDMALWSESAIPWTYRSDDDLVREILRISAPSGMTHILGMNTAVSEGIVYNSAYCLGPVTAGRYDKQVLLKGIEQPWLGWLIPFFSSGGYAVQPGPCAKPLPTPFGQAGIMICNESAVPASAADAVRQGARFILNLSNDGWFSDTYLVDQHFYNVRLRAVETRRDIAVNSNNGISGLVAASGRIEEERRGDDPFVSIVSVQPRDGLTPAVRYPLLPVALCGLYLLLLPYLKKDTNETFSTLLPVAPAGVPGLRQL